MSLGAGSLAGAVPERELVASCRTGDPEAFTQLVRMSVLARRTLYATAAALTLVGIFAMRWNVVIGGQLFSKSFLGYTTYKMEFATREGLLPAVGLMVLPFVILWVLVRLLPPWPEKHSEKASDHASGTPAAA
jgi:Ni/Fe-hydrogenase subunit HybB-like protein